MRKPKRAVLAAALVIGAAILTATPAAADTCTFPKPAAPSWSPITKLLDSESVSCGSVHQTIAFQWQWQESIGGLWQNVGAAQSATDSNDRAFSWQFGWATCNTSVNTKWRGSASYETYDGGVLTHSGTKASYPTAMVPCRA